MSSFNPSPREVSLSEAQLSILLRKTPQILWFCLLVPGWQGLKAFDLQASENICKWQIIFKLALM